MKFWKREHRRSGQCHSCHADVMYGICGNEEIRWIQHQGLPSEATSSIVSGVATLKPSAIGGHRVVVCFFM